MRRETQFHSIVILQLAFGRQPAWVRGADAWTRGVGLSVIHGFVSGAGMSLRSSSSSRREFEIIDAAWERWDSNRSRMAVGTQGKQRAQQGSTQTREGPINQRRLSGRHPRTGLFLVLGEAALNSYYQQRITGRWIRIYTSNHAEALPTFPDSTDL